MIRRAVTWLVVAVGLALPLGAWGQTVTVTSGEHDGFTRIALDFGSDIDWQMGRTIDGYALRVAGDKPEYNLDAVYDLIGRDRISALWVDEATGDLHLGIGCACFAQPFAFRPSIVVIDIKNGKPPKSSAFEEPLAGAQIPQPKPAPKPPVAAEDSGSSYDWVGARFDAPATDGADPAEVPVTPLPVGQGLEALRKALIEEMSRGAAAGLIDLTLPRDVTEGMVVGIPSARISHGDVPNYETHLGEASDVPVTASGGECLEDEALRVSDWAISDQPVSEQMSQIMDGLVGEFDRPEPEALARAVKFELYMGFGTEARALLRAFPTEDAAAGQWESMGFIMDDRPDTTGAFRSMAGCDTAAALWAVLSNDDPQLETHVDTKAVVRAFSALPPHLRKLLGARLADKLLAIGDDLAARSVRDAVTRLPGEKAPDVTLLEAKIDVAQGDLDAAEARLTPLAATSGPASEDALADLVATRATDLKPVPVEQVDALAALAQERRDGPDAQRFEAAVTLGRAAAGQFAEAFAGVEEQPDLAPRVWSILSVLGSDDDLVIHAIRPESAPPPVAAAVAAERIADRLLGLGFIDQAAAWLALAPDPSPLLVARLALAQKDGTTAIAAVAGIEEPEAVALKAESLGLTGNHRAAADVYQGLGNQDAYWAAEGLAQDWPVLAESGPAPWADAARALLTESAPPEPAPDQPAPGPLAEARAIVDQAAATRAALDALLAAVPPPESPSQ